MFVVAITAVVVVVAVDRACRAWSPLENNVVRRSSLVHALSRCLSRSNLNARLVCAHVLSAQIRA